MVGIPLFPWEEGYYFTVDNAPQAADRYQQWKHWTAEHGLVWDWVGLDIEPEARVYQQLMANPWGLVPSVGSRCCGTRSECDERGRRTWRWSIRSTSTAGRWRTTGSRFIADERRVGSTLLQRLMGLVDVRTDREVWMQYTSFVGSLGPGILWSYGPESNAIAVGTTGGGPDVPGHPQFTPLNWEELARDLRLARRWTDQLYIHSLEGCVWNRYLTRLRSLDWTPASTPPPTAPWPPRASRDASGCSAPAFRPYRTVGLVVATMWLAASRRRRRLQS